MKKIQNVVPLMAWVVAWSGTALAQPQVVPTIPVQSLPNPPASPVASEKPVITAVEDMAVTIGGFVKIDGLYSDFDRGDALTANGRDFYVPASIPVGDARNNQNSLDSHAKETRLFIKAATTFAEDIKVGTYIELDFLVSPGTGTAAVTNAYNPALRRAYLTYNSFLIGQDWTTFQNLSALPEGLDFIGPTEGTVFGRQPMLRYSWNGWQFALENAETSLLARGGASRVLTDDNVLPDLIVRYDLKNDFGMVSFAALGRQLRSRIQAPATLASSEAEMAGGLSIAGKVNVNWLGANDDLRFNITGGTGIGRYLGINTVTDSVVKEDGGLKTIPLVGGYLAFRHVWTPKLRSTVTASVLNAYNEPELTGAAATKRVDSYHVNLLYSPVKAVTFGIEGLTARRQSETQHGYLRRVQISMKYSF